MALNGVLQELQHLCHQFQVVLRFLIIRTRRRRVCIIIHLTFHILDLLPDDHIHFLENVFRLRVFQHKLVYSILDHFVPSFQEYIDEVQEIHHHFLIYFFCIF